LSNEETRDYSRILGFPDGKEKVVARAGGRIHAAAGSNPRNGEGFRPCSIHLQFILKEPFPFGPGALT
jgi:hypothetical protein